MNVTPSWDLFIVVFFGLIITYSFIVGKHQAIKIIIATYISVLAVEGIGNVITRVSGDSLPMLSVIGLNVNTDVLTAIKLIIFVVLIVFLTIRSGVEIEYGSEPSGLVNVLLTGLFGFATAGLLLISLFVFVANVPLLDPSIEQVPVVSSLLEKSKLMQIMILNQDLWFSLPALLLICVGMMSNETASVVE